MIGNLLEYLGNIEDPRREHPNKLHKLRDIIGIVIVATLARCETWEEVADYALEREAFFKQFLELPNGIPSHDTLNRVFSRIDPVVWQHSFIAWMKTVSPAGADKARHIQIDGKTLRGSKTSGQGKNESKQAALELMTAWVSQEQLVLGQMEIGAKSNEISVAPELLKLIDLEDAVVSADAILCQKEIAAQIIEQGGDYILALKGNQGSLYQAAQDLFDDQVALLEPAQSVDVAHGREEERTCWVLADLKQLQLADCKVQDWLGLKSILVVEAKTLRQGKQTQEKRFYLSSLDSSPHQALPLVRGHWSIENQQHYVLDVTFREDSNRTRKGYAAQNLALVRRLVVNLLNLDTSLKISKRRKRFRALLNDQYLCSLIGLPLPPH